MPDVLLDAPDFATALTAARRHLHARPELGHAEHETAAFVEANLRALGLSPRRVAETGVVVDIEGVRPGPLRCYRADLDALPIQDAKVGNVPYASTRTGVAHLCGHDAHTSIGLGVARRLVERQDELAGTVRIFFQPNEEGTPSGAPHMIAAGVLDGDPVAVAAVHVDPTLAVGQFGFIAGPVTASFDRLDLVVRGPATIHSARPHLATDTVWIATTFAQHLYTLAGRVTDARLPAVLAITRLQAGDAYNVIPDRVTMGGTLRCLSPETRLKMRAAIAEAAEAFSQMHGATVEAGMTFGSPPVMNDPALVALARNTVADLYGGDAVVDFPLPSMGAEDFAFYTERVPGLFVRVGTRSSEATAFPVHDAHFDLDESALAPAADAMAEVLVRLG